MFSTEPKNRKQASTPTVVDNHCVEQSKSNVVGTSSTLPLPSIEVGIYILTLVSTIVYATYSAYIASSEYEHILYYLKPGWNILGRKKDTSNFEWAFWSGWFFKMAPFFISHVLLSRIFDVIAQQRYKQYFYLLHSMLAIGYVAGPVHLTLLVMCILLHHIVATYTGSKLLVWIVNIGTITTLNFSQFTNYMRLLTPNDPESLKYYLLNFTLAMVSIKALSFSLEQCSQRCEKKQPFTLLNTMCYAFYLPLLHMGPHLTFHQFHTQYHKPKKPFMRQELVHHLMSFIRVIFWLVFIEVFLHYMYINAMLLDYRIMATMSYWRLAGVGFWLGHFFHLKYVVFFGLPSIMARLDGFHPPEKGPVCISMVYLYSNMWRNFDRGLYEIIKRHIYVPMGGSRTGFLQESMASAACFLYVWYWHGGEVYLFLWVLLNFIGIRLEILPRLISNNSHIKHFKVTHFSSAMWYRIETMCVLPMFMTSALAIFYFFGGLDIGHLFMYRIFREGMPFSTAVMLFCFYSFVHTVKVVERYQKNRGII